MKTLSIYLLMSASILFSCTNHNQDSIPPAKEGMITVTGGKGWYHIVDADGEGIPLLAIHGGPGAPHDYLEPLEALADERPVIFYDQLGCGNSERPDDTTLWNVPRFVDELEQGRTDLNHKKVHLLGTSWGTMLAVEYMLRKKPDEYLEVTRDFIKRSEGTKQKSEYTFLNMKSYSNCLFSDIN